MGPITKVKPQLDVNYCKKQGKEMFFRIKKSSKLSLKTRKTIIINF